MEHNIYDKSYKELFSRPEIVRDFLRGFVDEDFVQDIDFDNIVKLGATYVTETFKDRETDLILKLNLKNSQCAYLYILLEFQSYPDRFIALRILEYLILFYQELIKTKQIKGQELLPPVFPVLLYTGEQEYASPVCVEDLIAKPYSRLIKYLPRFEHYKVTFPDLSKNKDKLYKMSRLDNNIVAALFAFLTSSDNEETKETGQLLGDKIDYRTELGRFLAIWLRKYLKEKNIDVEITIKEGRVMLETVIERNREEGKLEGKSEVAKKALAKGYSIEEVADLTGLSLEEIEKLIKSD